jgi:hypothetical protein
MQSKSHHPAPVGGRDVINPVTEKEAAIKWRDAGFLRRHIFSVQVNDHLFTSVASESIDQFIENETFLT